MTLDGAPAQCEPRGEEGTPIGIGGILAHNQPLCFLTKCLSSMRNKWEGRTFSTFTAGLRRLKSRNSWLTGLALAWTPDRSLVGLFLTGGSWVRGIWQGVREVFRIQVQIKASLICVLPVCLSEESCEGTWFLLAQSSVGAPIPSNGLKIFSTWWNFTFPNLKWNQWTKITLPLKNFRTIPLVACTT